MEALKISSLWMILASSAVSGLKIGNINLYQLMVAPFSQTVIETVAKVVERNAITVVQGATNNETLETIFDEVVRAHPSQYFSAFFSGSQCSGSACPRDEYAAIIVNVGEASIRDFKSQGSSLLVNPVTAIVTPAAIDIPEFRIVNVHLNSQDIDNELDILYDLRNNDYNDKELLIIGDFNAGPPFINFTDLDQTALFSDSGVDSLLGHEVDSIIDTRFNTSLQRILVYGDLRNSVVGGSAQNVDIIKEYGLIYEEVAAEVLFYPTEFELREEEAIGK